MNHETFQISIFFPYISSAYRNTLINFHIIANCSVRMYYCSDCIMYKMYYKIYLK